MRFRIFLAAAALALAAGCSSSSSPTSPSTGSGSPVAIVSGASTLTTTAYNPNPITIAAGGSVTWTNNDNTAHTSVANNGLWNSGTIAPGGNFTMTFATAGTYTYHCSIHPNMSGTVTVQ